MRPLTLDDLLSPAEFLARRDEFFEANQRYGEQYRRVRVGPLAVLFFENRQTLWFRVQELLRVLRLQDPAWIEAELRIVNQLLPGHNELGASLMLGDDMRPDGLQLCVDRFVIPSNFASCRPEDRAAGSSHWVRFEFTLPQRRAFADIDTPAWFEIDSHASERMTEEMRQSLLDDLEASDGDAD